MEAVLSNEGEMIAKALHLEVGKSYRVQLIVGEAKHMYLQGSEGPVLHWKWLSQDFRCLARYVVHVTPA